MRSTLTPAAERATTDAGHFGSVGDAAGATAALVLGLLHETECRAAEILAAAGVTEELMRARWPALTESALGASFGNAPVEGLRRVVRAVEEMLDDFPPPLSLGTEHLLLGVLANGDAVADWLAGYGLRVEPLVEEIRQREGRVLVNDEPIEVEGETGCTSPPVAAVEILPAAATEEGVLLRILDASANRAREGLRVVEDYVRFALDDAALARECKRLRHELAVALAYLPAALLAATRDTVGDVGTTISTASEMRRSNLAHVALASLKRAQEALRSLEEYGKLVSGELAAGCERLRYASYTLEKRIALVEDSRARLATARLYVLIDGGPSIADFERLTRELIDAGVDVLQLRDKGLADRELLARGRLLRRVTAGTQTLFVMNDRADLARLAEADGVHVGQEELSVREVRRLVGAGSLVGVSTHSIEQAREAVFAGANYIGVGPTFASGTKSFSRFTGVELLRQVAAEIRVPAFAIGGVSLENLDEVLAAGLERVAVSGAIVRSSDPGASAREFRRRLT
ncbi:MAG: thiamine phosphate synthase [Pirellulales bacterium]|nr:thiamine phosphate synthase [Pirellulales bacterium]